mgnify:CR=1 FL=1
MRIGDLIRSRSQPSFLGVILEKLDEELYYEDYIVHWFCDNDWSWEQERHLEVVCESR